MSATSNNCMFIGLPSSGKSSFIGALWHVVETGEIDAQYTVTSQPDDREYLNQLRDSFLACESPERTKTDIINRISLMIKSTETGQEFNLVFPDTSGETFRNHYEYRKVSNEFLDEISECSGIMLFINPKHLQKSNIIPNFGITLDEEEPVEVTGSDLPNHGHMPVNQVEWSSEMSQTQVVLVDILQMIRHRLVKPCKICVIISAWDLIKDTPDMQVSDVTPEEWLIKEIPLIYQFLRANNSIFSYEIFGVSAQGGKYADGEFKTEQAKAKALEIQEQLQSMKKQSARIRVQYGNEISNDITMPLNWLLNGK